MTNFKFNLLHIVRDNDDGDITWRYMFKKLRGRTLSKNQRKTKLLYNSIYFGALVVRTLLRVQIKSFVCDLSEPHNFAYIVLYDPSCSQKVTVILNLVFFMRYTWNLQLLHLLLNHPLKHFIYDFDRTIMNIPRLKHTVQSQFGPKSSCYTTQQIMNCFADFIYTDNK